MINVCECGIQNYKSVPEGFDFSTKFETYIIAYCPDTGEWFCTNERFFFYEYSKNFHTEKEAIEYFESHISEFIKIESLIKFYHHECDFVYLSNTDKRYYN